MQHAVPQAEDRGRRADAEGQCQHRDRGEPWPRRHRPERDLEILTDDVRMLARRDRQQVAYDLQPENRLAPPRPFASRIAELLREHEGHLLTVFVTEWRGITAQQDAEERCCALHTFRPRPVARAWAARPGSRATPA